MRFSMQEKYLMVNTPRVKLTGQYALGIYYIDITMWGSNWDNSDWQIHDSVQSRSKDEVFELAKKRIGEMVAESVDPLNYHFRNLEMKT